MTGYRFSSFHYEIQLDMLRKLSFSPFEQTRVVAAVWQHPEFDYASLRNDLTVVMVGEPFNINQWTTPICLPPPSFDPANGTLCTVVGWGNIQESGVDCKCSSCFVFCVYRSRSYNQLPVSI